MFYESCDIIHQNFLHCLLTFNIVDGKCDARLVILLQVTFFISQEKCQNLFCILSHLHFHNGMSWDVFIHCSRNSVRALIARFITGKSLYFLLDSVLHSIFFVLSFWNSGFHLSLDYYIFLALCYFLANFSCLSSQVSSKILLAIFCYPQGQCLGQFLGQWCYGGHQGQWHGEGNRCQPSVRDNGEMECKNERTA